MGRAYVELRLLDRAWIRLRDAVERDTPDPSALVLAARLFLLRGWPRKARGPLERALSDHPEDPELNALWALLDSAPIAPDPTACEGREPDDLDAWLPLAEAWMASGAFIKAQSILARLHRHHPDNQRVSDLLWALDGDFSTEDATLARLARDLGPSLTDLTGVGEIGDEVEHTESVTQEEIRKADPPPDPGSFPSLFRSPTEATTAPGGAPDEEASETTQATHLASAEELREAPPPRTLEPTPLNVPGDTQIMRVIHKVGADGQTHAAQGPVHEGVSTYDDSSFDLASFRREMGMPTSLPVSDFDHLEDEDEDLIIVTRAERDETEEVSTGLPHLELDPTTSELGDISEELEVVPVEEVLPEPAEPAEPPEAPDPPAPRRRRRRISPASWWLLAISGLAVLLVVLLLVAIGLHLLTTWL